VGFRSESQRNGEHCRSTQRHCLPTSLHPRHFRTTEGVRVAGVGHSENPVLGRYRRERVEHRDVSLDSDDTPTVRSATPLAFKSRAERSRDCEESLRAVVAFGGRCRSDGRRSHTDSARTNGGRRKQRVCRHVPKRIDF
jgi:hypothetical protein